MLTIAKFNHRVFPAIGPFCVRQSPVVGKSARIPRLRPATLNAMFFIPATERLFFDSPGWIPRDSATP